MDTESTGFIKAFLRAYPKRSALIVSLLILSGFAQGIGIVSLLPLLELAVADGTQKESSLIRAISEALATVRVRPTIGIMLSFIVFGMVLKALFLWLAAKQVGYTVARVATDLRLALLRALLRARWGYFITQRVGHIGNAIGTEAQRAANSYREACNFLAGIVEVLVYTGVAMLVSWKIALISIAAGALIAVPLGTFVRSARGAGRRQTELMKSVIGRLTDALHGIKPIKAMAREEDLWPMLEDETMDLNRALERQVLASESLRLFQEPILVVLLAIGLYVILTLGSQPLTAVLVMAFLFYRLVGRVQSMQRNYQNMSIGESAYWSLQHAVEHAASQRELSPGDRPPPALERSVVLKNVEFSYGDKPILDDVSLTVPAGHFVAIVGPSGAGKTTIADLIIGLYRPQAGEVFVDDIPLSEFDLLEWRHEIGYVPQEMFLFHDSVLRNVTLGDETIAPHRVQRALEDAGAWSFVAELPQKLETVIGERGAKLSGGQRQRIAIARALLRNPRMLVLDEVTTSLDPATEAAICETLRKLRGKVTVLAISHQSAMMEAADLVYRLEGGKLEIIKEGVEADAAITA